MAYLNMNNINIFEGRLTADPELSYIPTKNGQQGLAKCKIKIAVDKQMTKEQKAQAQASGNPTADFVPIEVTGPKAEFVSNYFSKGNGIRAVCTFRTFNYQAQDGSTKYGYNFDAVDVTFPIGGNGNKNGNNGGNGDNGGFQDPGFAPMGLDPQGFQAIDDDDLPF